MKPPAKLCCRLVRYACVRCGNPACPRHDLCHGCRRIICRGCDAAEAEPFFYAGDIFKHPHSEPAPLIPVKEFRLLFTRTPVEMVLFPHELAALPRGTWPVAHVLVYVAYREPPIPGWPRTPIIGRFHHTTN